ncbi:MAG: KamA family radical SAM protein [Planctomyces sp.]|nr:KamA family radical SAM protein [Planctomyces sp.]
MGASRDPGQRGLTVSRTDVDVDSSEEPPGRQPDQPLVTLPILESGCGSQATGACGSPAGPPPDDHGPVIVDLDVPLADPVATPRSRTPRARKGRAAAPAKQTAGVVGYSQPGTARRTRQTATQVELPVAPRFEPPALEARPAAPQQVEAAPVGEADATGLPFVIRTTSRRSSTSPRTRAFRKKFFPDASEKDWNDWRWQSRHRIRTLEQMERMLSLHDDERAALVEGGSMLPVGITPYYMSLLDPDDAAQPLRRTVVPSRNEFLRTRGEADDPLGEDGHSPVPGLVHRYPDRVLLLALDFCSTYCRYCTRSRVVGHGELFANEKRLELAFDYLRKTPQVRDVLISGGDPLSLSEDKLDWILGRLRAIPHIEFIRIGTKMPAVLPQRITPQLTRMLRKYHPLWMSVHFLHPDECTPEAARACGRLADAGIPLGAQTVLLKGVNDSVDTMKQLIHKLLLMRVRPYYLYQCDPISGSAHFRTSVAKGLEIIEGLRGHTTGYGVPNYVIDAPGGGGKIPLQPNYLVGRDGDDVLLRNFEGKTYRYPDPVDA